MGTTHIVKNVGNKLLLEADAEVALRDGYKYFAIVKPINTSDEMITSPEELHKICFSKGIGSSFYDFGKQCSFSEGPFSFANVIVAFKERPVDVLTIDAREMIEYLQSSKIYVDKKDIEMYEMKDEYR